MKILDDLLSTLKQGAMAKDVRQGPFQTAVLTRGCRLASTPHHDPHHQDDAPVKRAGTLIGKRALELALMAYSPSLHEAAIGMATINSLLEVDEQHCLSLNASDLLAEKGRNKKVVLVGHSPFVTKLRQLAKKLWVLEQHPQQGDFTESEAENLVPQADVVSITGSAFTNHTIEHLLGLCRPEAYIIVLGLTAPLSSVLFDYGVDTISGTKVIDIETALQCVSQGATFRQIRGIRLLTIKR